MFARLCDTDDGESLKSFVRLVAHNEFCTSDQRREPTWHFHRNFFIGAVSELVGEKDDVYEFTKAFIERPEEIEVVA